MLRRAILLAVLIWFAGIASVRALEEGAAQPSLHVYFFASSSCDECREIRESVLPSLTNVFGDKIRIVHVAVDDIESFRLQILYEKHYGVIEGNPVEIFVGSKALVGFSEIRDGAERAIRDQLASGAATPAPDELMGLAAASRGGIDDVRARFKALKLAVVMLAGIVDGVNPCAFTTLVFFVSLLTALGKSRRQLLAVGLAFAVGVFITYFGLGFGALKMIQAANVSRGLSAILRYVVAAFAFILSALSFYDAARYRSSGSGGIVVKLPDSLRARIRSVMSRVLHDGYLVVGGLILGVLVTLLESLCTGQMYLPTIMFAVSDPALRNQALGLLLLYNVAFILPLIVVFVLAYMGIRSEKLASFSRNHVALVKVLLGIAFLALGIGLLFR